MEVSSASDAQRIEVSFWFQKVHNGSAGGEQTQGYLGARLTIQSDSTVLTFKCTGVT